ncbi:MAG: hypothetical protein LCH88_09025 [Proteobacteria bacterium]|nr:hypothetical protein [Pseudomonadota bacterium]
MTTRARQEKFICDHDTPSGREFDRALGRVISEHRGVSFFTDEQIAEITAEMARKARKDSASHARICQQARALLAARERVEAEILTASDSSARDGLVVVRRNLIERIAEHV